MHRASCPPPGFGHQNFGASDGWAVPGRLRTHWAHNSSPRHLVPLSASLLGSNFSAFFGSISAPSRAPPSLFIWWGAESFAVQGLAGAVARWKSFYLCWAGSSMCQMYLPFSLKRIQGQFVENVVWPVWKGADRLQAVFRKQAAAQVTFATAGVSAVAVWRDWGR